MTGFGDSRYEPRVRVDHHYCGPGGLMPDKRKGKKVRDLKTKSLGSKAEKIKGGAEPVGLPRKAEPITGRPRPVEPVNG